MTQWSVVISGRGRAGTITYAEGEHEVHFEWELGGEDVVAIISGPAPQNWDPDLPWAQGRRREILNRVAQEVIRVQAPNSRAELADGDTIVLREAP
jgi:hypothetical protein